jgi:hypothetical protein
MPNDSELISIAVDLRQHMDARVDNCSYVSRVVTTGKGNKWFQVITGDGSYMILVKKIDPEDT